MTVYTSMYHFEAEQPLRLAGFWAELLRIPVDDGASDDLAMNLFRIFAPRAT